MTEASRFVNGRSSERDRSLGGSRAVWQLSIGALGVCLVQLACSKSEPRPATPQTEPNAVTAAPTSPAVTVAPGSAATQATSTALATPATATTTTSRWPSALAEQPGAPGEQPGVEQPDTTPNAPSEPEPTGLAALASNRESSKITGCLTEAPTRSAPTRANAKQSSNGETWRATALGNGVLVTHTLEHACCLKGTAKATVSGATITVEEQLTGQPCRCLCESTIQTRVPAPPGEYDVQSVTVTNGQRHVVQTQRVTVGLTPHPAKTK